MTVAKKELIYDSDERKNPALEEIREVFRYRNLIFQLTRRDVLTRYKRSILGIAWTMINPLGMMIVLTIAFSQIFRVGGETESYTAYVLSGLLLWNFFSQTTTAAMVNLVWGGQLLHRVYIPRTSFALAAVATGVVNFSLSLLPLFIVMLVTGVKITPTVLLFPIPILLVSLFAIGIGLLVSTFAVYFPDVAEMYQIIISAWMYLTPIIYPETILPDSYKGWITALNPMYYMVKLFRKSVLYGEVPSLADYLIPLGIALAVVTLGWFVFTRKADEFAYRV